MRFSLINVSLASECSKKHWKIIDMSFMVCLHLCKARFKWKCQSLYSLCVDATAHTCGSSLERLKASLNLHRVLSTCGLFPPCSPLTSPCRTMPGLQSSQAPCFHIGLLPKPRQIRLSQDAPCQDTLPPAGLTRHGAEGRASETDCDSPSSEMPDTGPC